MAFTLENFDEEEQTVTEELESLLLESLDQLSANAAYEKRDWQTQAYKVLYTRSCPLNKLLTIVAANKTMN